MPTFGMCTLNFITTYVIMILLCFDAMIVATCDMSTLNLLTTYVIMILPICDVHDSCYL
jgi:hypothetical protein